MVELVRTDLRSQTTMVPPIKCSGFVPIHEALDGVEVAGSKGRGVVGDEAQRVRVHDTLHP